MSTQTLARPKAARPPITRIERMSALAPERVVAPDALTWSEWDGMLILDACGTVTFCSKQAARLLGKEEREMLGLQITALLPELPFGRYTPEFNLAYVAFHGDDGVWCRHSLLTSTGKRLPVTVSLGNLVEVGKRSIVLILRQTPGAAPPLADATETPVSA